MFINLLNISCLYRVEGTEAPDSPIWQDHTKE